MATVLTIGYSQDGFEPFEERLALHGVQVLVDVRSAPYSKYQTDFRYGVIEALCLQAGLDYLFLGDKLGGKPTDPELLTEGRPDYEKIAADTGFHEGLQQVVALSAEKTVCLMCGCERPMRCHRGKLIAPQLMGLGVDVRHIDRAGRSLTHDEAVNEESGGQMSLF
jgi:uncharacterized protein (DUF488 family)